MKIKQTIRNLVLGGLLVASMAMAAIVPSSPTYAATCGNVETSIIACDESGDGKEIENSGIWGILMLVINIMTAGVGVLALAGIIYGAVLYTSAGGNTEQVKKAYGIFTNVVIGVIAFGGMFALLNFIVPGGVFN